MIKWVPPLPPPPFPFEIYNGYSGRILSPSRLDWSNGSVYPIGLAILASWTIAEDGKGKGGRDGKGGKEGRKGMGGKSYLSCVVIAGDYLIWSD